MAAKNHFDSICPVFPATFPLNVDQHLVLIPHHCPDLVSGSHGHTNTQAAECQQSFPANPAIARKNEPKHNRICFNGNYIVVLKSIKTMY